MAKLIDNKTKGYKYFWWYVAQAAFSRTAEDIGTDKSYYVAFNWLRKGREITLGTSLNKRGLHRKTFSKAFKGQTIRIKLMEFVEGGGKKNDVVVDSKDVTLG